MFKRSFSLDKKLLQKKSHSDPGKTPTDAGKTNSDPSKHSLSSEQRHPDAGETTLDPVERPPTVGKSPQKAGKPSPDAAPENNMEEIHVENEKQGEKPRMGKSLSMSTTSSEKEFDEDAANVSELEQSGRRKVSVGYSGISKDIKGYVDTYNSS